jgi:predicted GNAT superfamily acetyltransferase
MGEVQIRHCHGLAEFEACVDLQRAVWGYDERDIIPDRVFVVAKKIGGQVIGAFDGQHLVGFALGLPGYRNGRSYFHSHMLAVSPEYRNQGLGARLKLAQRDDALARGIELMEWTFDPLEIKNAHLNINRLGAVVRRYVPNQYGDSSSPLQGGLPTDRIIAEWWLSSRRVQQRLDLGSFPVYEITQTVKVPAEIRQWKDTRDSRGREAQTRIRKELTSLMRQGLTVLEYRVGEDGSGEFRLGVWEESWSYGPAPDQQAHDHDEEVSLGQGMGR